VKKCSSKNRKEFLFFSSISLIELFANCSESKDNASVGRMVSGSMKVMWCSVSKWFYDTSIGIATRAVRCGSFVKEGLGVLKVLSYRGT
jgi:hypothetical protein